MSESTSTPARPTSGTKTLARSDRSGPKVLSLGPLALLIFVFSLGSAMVAPTLPLFARSLGADYRGLGIIGASQGLAYAVLTIPLGRASDRLGRGPLLLASTVAVGAAAASYRSATGILGLAGSKFLETLGLAAFWPALMALITERFDERAARAVGVGFGVHAVAFVIGTSVAGFVIEAAGPRAPFAVCIVTAATAFYLVLVVPGMRIRIDASGTVRPQSGMEAAGRGARRIQRFLIYVTSSISSIGVGSVFAFLPAYAANLGLRPSTVGLLISAYWMARFCGAVTTGRLSARHNSQAILIFVMLLTAVSAALVALATGVVMLFVGTVGLGVTAGTCTPTCLALIANTVSGGARGTTIGLFEALAGLAVVISGLLGGYLAEAVNPGAPYLLVSGLAVAWVLFLLRRHRYLAPSDFP